MEQYENIKKNHPNELLLFRMGDFYELFQQDAVTASKVLNITLTQRNKKSGDETPMCGFPHHSMEGPINKLLEAGHSVAVCNQLEDPSEAKGLVKRGVTLMLSPGVVFNPDELAQDQNVYVLSFEKNEVCWIEPSTGKAFYEHCKEGEFKQFLRSLILKIKPREVLVKNEADKKTVEFFYSGHIVEVQKKTSFENAASLKPKELLIKYIKTMQGEQGAFGFTDWEELDRKKSVVLNEQFFNHLEVFQSNDKDKTKSLFNSVKKTKTPGGTRLLRDWLENPTTDENVILSRHQKIKMWTNDFERLQSFRDSLAEIGDFERRIARAGHTLGQPQDLVRLKKTLVTYLRAFDSKEVNLIKLCKTLEDSLVEEPVSSWQTKGGFIKRGFSNDLDALMDTSSNAQIMIQDLEAKEKKSTGINSLKIRFNSVFGFFIEVTKSHKDKVPSHYMRKQTLTNAERYSTEELSLIEEKVLTAKSKKISLEKEIFEEIKLKVRENLKFLKEAAKETSLSDLSSALAYLIVEKNFSLPQFNTNKLSEIKGGFHPVVADELNKKAKGAFVSNDIKLTQGEGFYMITGPNMAGKSTLMRMVVIHSYLAQCGLPCPCKEAQLNIYNGLFTRVGASDVLSEGLSTFMVEMVETADILKFADENSLLILDEIGRGTSSQDGKSLAKSIINYIALNLKSHCLFATHYHELTEEFLNLKNIHLGYVEENNKIHFTYKIKDGPSLKSYGIEVAELAGVPEEIVAMAKEFNSSDVTNKASDENKSLKAEKLIVEKEEPQEQLAFWGENSKVNFVEELSSLDLNQMTPVEALIKLSKWKEDCF